MERPGGHLFVATSKICEYMQIYHFLDALASLDFKMLLSKGSFHEKNCCSLGFCQNGGGMRPAQICSHIFIRVFLVNKRSLFSPKCQ